MSQIQTSIMSHHSLTGLTTGDDHTQYVLLAGRAGGQIIKGGTGVGENLSFWTNATGTVGTYYFTDLFTDGFVKTTGGTGALSIDTTLYVKAVSDTPSLDLTLAGQSISGVVLAAGVDHGGLGGLSDDDHTQYAFLAGRNGGQILIGGTGAGDDLTLTSTSHGTLGDYLLTGATSRLLLNETSNADMANAGITINQGTLSGITTAALFTGKHAGVSHGMTSEIEDDTFLEIKTNSVAAGGVRMTGVTEATIGYLFQGLYTTGDTTKGTTALSPFWINVAKKSGTTIGAPGANENLVTISGNASIRWIVDAEGDTHRDGTDNTFDDYDDSLLARAFNRVMNPDKTGDDPALDRYTEGDLRAAKVIHSRMPGKDGKLPLRPFFNESALLRLAIGAVAQSAPKLKKLETDLAATKAELAVTKAEVAKFKATSVLPASPKES